MIAAIVGKLGRGKTLLLTILAYNIFKNGSLSMRRYLFPEIFDNKNTLNIYSNYHLKFKYKPLHSLDNLTEMRDGCAFLDEFWSWVDSRCSMKKRNQGINQIALASRKRGIDMYYTTQTWGKVDKRIRDITDIVIIPEFDFKSGWLKYQVLEALADSVIVIAEGSIFARGYFNMYDTDQEIADIHNDSKQN